MFAIILPPYAFTIFVKYTLAINKLKKVPAGSSRKNPTKVKIINIQNILK
jgi:hypothetical protein